MVSPFLGVFSRLFVAYFTQAESHLAAHCAAESQAAESQAAESHTTFSQAALQLSAVSLLAVLLPPQEAKEMAANAANANTNFFMSFFF